MLLISDFVSCKINAAFLSCLFVCFNPSANSGLVGYVCHLSGCTVYCSPRNLCQTSLRGHFGVAFPAWFIGTRRNCLRNPSISCVVFSGTAVITVP